MVLLKWNVARVEMDPFAKRRLVLKSYAGSNPARSAKIYIGKWP